MNGSSAAGAGQGADGAGPRLDVFISYAHIDNQPLLADVPGWVTVFHEALQQLLSRFKGSAALIWRDPKLAGNDVLWQEIEARVAEAAVLVSVLSPRYVSSPSCAQEIEAFCRQAEHSGGLVIDHSARVFKVIKTPVEGEQGLPPIVSALLGYEFFRLDADQTPLELDPLFGPEAREEFLRKVNKVAWDIKRLLDQLRRAAAGASPAAGAKPVVYLAECSRDRRDEREIIEAELKRLGHVVLPDRQLPTDEADYVAAVDALLARSAFSIHLIGDGYGLVPDGPGDKSIVVLQNERAAAHFGAGRIRRVIWLPEEIRAEQAAQQAFIDELHASAQAQAGADLLTGDLEALKGALRSHLKRIEADMQPASRPDPGTGGGAARRVFLVCEARDRLEVVPLLKALRARGYEVSLPLFTGEAAALRQAFAEQAAAAGRVILYYGAGDEAWKYHQLNELSKARGRAGGGAAAGCGIWLAPPASDDKTLLQTLAEPGTGDGLGGGLEAVLDGLLAQLAPTGEAP